MTVVSSIGADELDPTRLKARGALMLRDFLAHAAASAAAATDGDRRRRQRTAPTESVVMAEFARRLRASGLVVHERYGRRPTRSTSPWRTRDHRGRMVVAVESDGPEYAAMSSARDRDRLRAEHLGRLGWKHVRVWTRDAFRDPARDVARIQALAERGAP